MPVTGDGRRRGGAGTDDHIQARLLAGRALAADVLGMGALAGRDQHDAVVGLAAVHPGLHLGGEIDRYPDIPGGGWAGMVSSTALSNLSPMVSQVGAGLGPVRRDPVHGDRPFRVSLAAST